MNKAEINIPRRILEQLVVSSGMATLPRMSSDYFDTGCSSYVYIHLGVAMAEWSKMWDLRSESEIDRDR
ncbi:hypothetical protein J6590_096168 [Homalodisca vitripennis]|nr:hypothetical protein J6590_096168 [Homalodisca vitripennis]